MKRPWEDPVDYPPPLERLELETLPPPENFNRKNYKSESEETFDNDLPAYDELVEAKAFGDATAPSYLEDEEFWKDFWLQYSRFCTYNTNKIHLIINNFGNYRSRISA